MQLLLNKRMKHHWVQNAVYYNKLRTLLRRVFPNYISFTTSLISASRKTCAFYVNELSIGPYMCYTRRVSVITVTGLPFHQRNLPVPYKLGRETRCVLQHWNGIFPTSELSFTRGFMNELMTDWWWIIINNILLLPECILDYSFKLTLNHQGPYNSKVNRYGGKLVMNGCITRETFVFTVFRRVFHSTLKLELCRHACRCRDPIISTCRYGKNMPTTALVQRSRITKADRRNN